MDSNAVTKKDLGEVATIENGLNEYFLPSVQRTIYAHTLEEAVELLNKEPE